MTNRWTNRRTKMIEDLQITPLLASPSQLRIAARPPTAINRGHGTSETRERGSAYNVLVCPSRRTVGGSGKSSITIFATHAGSWQASSTQEDLAERER